MSEESIDEKKESYCRIYDRDKDIIIPFGFGSISFGAVNFNYTKQDDNKCHIVLGFFPRLEEEKDLPVRSMKKSLGFEKHHDSNMIGIQFKTRDDIHALIEYLHVIDEEYERVGLKLENNDE